ncbi:DUF3048 C-terminal domain-containing protein [uncultured Friedmanniella sp.]|uniref:DUF3048 domain-containing protein n=1 Tax=uncultured Friedmanniella sp. TaxID=335381 RepID=UPI0035CC136F
MRRIARRNLLAGVAGVAALAVTACSRAKPSPTAPSVAPPTSAPPTTVSPKPVTPSPPVDNRPRWPLTGKLLKDKSDARHAAVAVKVPDNRVEHPQRGIDQADIVFVELDGYRDSSGHSGTRLVPVFHSRMPDTVEPVRSIRPVDIPLLSPMDAIIGNTGAAPWVVKYVKHYRAHLEGALSYLATYGTGSYGTDPSRVYHYNGQTYYDRATTCHPKILAKQTKRFRAGPPQLYFPYASTADDVSAAKGKRGRSVKVPYKGDDYFMGYEYDAKSQRYLRSMPWGPHVLADGTRVSTDNVLVIFAHQHYGKIFRGKGHDEPLHDVIHSSGKFIYFHRGRYVRGTWKKGGITKPFTFTVADGKPLQMATGQTFVELPDTHAKVRISS